MSIAEDWARVIITPKMYDRGDVHIKGSIKGDLKG